MINKFWQTLEDLVEQILTKECLFVLIDANAGTGRKVVGCGDGEYRGLGAYGCHVLNDNGKRLLSFATNYKLALTIAFFRTCKGGISHTHNGTSPNDSKRIDYILTRYAHRRRVHDANVVPQRPPPAKADSDHNIVPGVYEEYASLVTLHATDKNERRLKAVSLTDRCLCPTESVVSN